MIDRNELFGVYKQNALARLDILRDFEILKRYCGRANKNNNFKGSSRETRRNDA
jgi:hypothetical protein